MTLALWHCLVGWPMALAARRRDHRAFTLPPPGDRGRDRPRPRTNRGRGRGRRDGDGNLKVPGCPRPGLDATLESEAAVTGTPAPTRNPPRTHANVNRGSADWEMNISALRLRRSARVGQSPFLSGIQVPYVLCTLKSTACQVRNDGLASDGAAAYRSSGEMWPMTSESDRRFSVQLSSSRTTCA